MANIERRYDKVLGRFQVDSRSVPGRLQVWFQVGSGSVPGRFQVSSRSVPGRLQVGECSIIICEFKKAYFWLNLKIFGWFVKFQAQVS